jgi:2-polyprenyl-3-methyl-5-hydroxy-6-metoxy-1,4-benzoquinol methylase
MPYWWFDKFLGEKVLDARCGLGWVKMQYVAVGANVFSVYLMPNPVEIAKTFLASRGLTLTVAECDAEQLQFPGATFDLVVSSGVLQHTPDTEKSIWECFRVLKAVGRSKLIFFFNGSLPSPLMFVTRSVMRLAAIKHPDADLAKEAKHVDDFIRQYDAANNPVCVGYMISEWEKILRESGFLVLRHESHFSPRRFIPMKRFIPRFVQRICDRWFWTMVYFELKKP